jgi:hypothetical protein
MLDSKFLFTLVGLIVAVMAICNTNFNPSISESYINVGRKAVAVKTQSNGKGNMYAVQGSTQSMLGSGPFVSFPSYQSSPPPRFSSTGYGAYINYSAAPYEAQGVPRSPLGYGNMAEEGYQDVKEDYSCGADCQTSGNPTGLPGSGPPPPKAVDYINAANKMYEGGEESLSMLPLSSMETVGIDGDTQQVVTYNNFMYANQKSFTGGQGCPLRGDLAIAPCTTGWFNTPYRPNIDLRQGALNVMGGNFNETANALYSLQYTDSGGTEKFNSGVYMGNDIRESLSAGQTDVNATAFI